jgi:hypothetical protein
MTEHIPHTEHVDHGHESAEGPALTSLALSATLHCLTGCAIIKACGSSATNPAGTGTTRGGYCLGS